MTTIGAAEVARRTGASYRQVDYWARTGVLVPALRRADGPGYSRAYAPRQVAVAAALLVLARLGAKVPAMARASAQLTGRDDEAWDRLVVVSADGVVEDLADADGPGWLLDLTAFRDLLGPRAALVGGPVGC